MTYKIKNLWPTPLYLNNIGVDKETLDFALTYPYNRLKVKNGSDTADKKILNKMPLLKKQLEDEISKFVYDYLKTNENIKFEITTSWINKHLPGDHAHVHYHQNAMFSGVYYIKQPENGGDFLIHENPFNPNIVVKTVGLDFTEWNDTNAKNIYLKVKSGMVIIFPSFVFHSVENNQSNEDRYSLAFNVFARGKLGKEEFELNV